MPVGRCSSKLSGQETTSQIKKVTSSERSRGICSFPFPVSNAYGEIVLFIRRHIGHGPRGRLGTGEPDGRRAGAIRRQAVGARICRRRANIASAAPPFYAEAQLGLARAHAMGGDKANAKKAYEAFFTTWKDADADLPMLVAAKKEYEGL